MIHQCWMDCQAAHEKEEEDIADEITAAHHGHDGSSSKTAKSEGTNGSSKTSKESKSVSLLITFVFSFPVDVY